MTDDPILAPPYRWNYPFFWVWRDDPQPLWHLLYGYFLAFFLCWGVIGIITLMVYTHIGEYNV